MDFVLLEIFYGQITDMMGAESPCIFQKYSETLHDVVQVCVFTSCKKSSIRKCSKMDWGVILEENCNFWPPKKWVLNSDYDQNYFSAPKKLDGKKRLGENISDFRSWSIEVLEGHEIAEPILSKCEVMGLLFLFESQMGKQPLVATTYPLPCQNLSILSDRSSCWSLIKKNTHKH